MTAPTYAEFFAGIGGFRLALDASGFRCVYACEIDPFCRKVYKERFGHEPQAEDIRKVRPEDIPDADVWVGGFPCQDISVAGKRRGLRMRDRSGLVWKFLELAAARRPKWCLLENVPGLFTLHGGADYGLLLAEMGKLWPAVGWATLDAQYARVPQRRRRIFLVAGPRREDLEAVLFEPSRRCWHFAARTQARPDASPSIGGGPDGAGRTTQDCGNIVVGCLGGRSSGGPDDNDAQGGHLVASTLQASQGHHGHSSPRGDGSDNLITTHDIAPCLQERDAKGQDSDCTKLLVIQDVRGTRQKKQNGIGISDDDKSYTVDAMSRHGVAYNVKGSAQGGKQHAKKTETAVALQGKGGKPTGNEAGTIIAATVRTNALNNSDPTTEAKALIVQEAQSGVSEYDTAGTLRADAPGHQPGGSLVRQHMWVRHLTASECERLMGLPDGHSCLCGIRPDCPDRRVPAWIDPWKISLDGCGHSACGCECPDTRRYRVLGNAVAVPVVRWIATRLLEAMR